MNGDIFHLVGTESPQSLVAVILEVEMKLGYMKDLQSL